MGSRAATLVVRELERRGHTVHLVDPLELQLPLLDRMYKEYPKGEAPETLERLAELYRRVDGFLVVSGEYNHGIPPALKNLLDHFLEEYFWRPSGIVCYSAGGFGGVRAAMQLRMTLAELGMSSVPSLLPIPRISQSIDDDGVAQEPIVDRAANRFLDEFLWYAGALAQARTNGTPY
jgi:NAD(P)H-dependent FMN reductase